LRGPAGANATLRRSYVGCGACEHAVVACAQGPDIAQTSFLSQNSSVSWALFDSYLLQTPQSRRYGPDNRQNCDNLRWIGKKNRFGRFRC